MISKLNRIIAACAAALVVVTLATAQEGAKPAGDKILNKLSVTKGQVLWFKSAMNMTQEIDMGGQGFNVVVDVNRYISVTVGEVKPDAVEAELKVGRVWGAAEIPMQGEVTFDSDKPSEDDGGMMGGLSAVTKLAGKRFKVVFDATSRVKSVEAIDKIEGGMMGQNPGEAIKAELESIFGMIPAEGRAVGEKWEAKQSTNLQQVRAAIKGEATLSKADANEFSVAFNAKIDAETLKASMADVPEEQKAMLESMTIEDGNVASNVRISRKDGLVLAADATSKMSMSMDSPAGDGGSMTINMTMSQKMERTEAPKAAESKPAEKKAEEKPAEKPADKPAEKKDGN